jgi:hypothetical protein
VRAAPPVFDDYYPSMTEHYEAQRQPRPAV